MVQGKFTPLVLSAVFVTGCQSWSVQDIENMPPSAALPDQSEPGWVELRYFDNVPGTGVGELTTLARFPDNPDEIVQISRLDVPSGRSDNYGSLVRGYIQPPVDGQYRFFVSGDDQTQFLLSSGQSSADAEVVASVTGWTSSGQFDKYTSQTSPYLSLSAGKRYYFELRHKEGTGGDHFSVAWEGPGFSRSVIDSQYLHSPAISSQLYADDGDAATGFSRGYRVGFFDGKQSLPFNDRYPPLDEDQDGLYDNWEVQAGLDPTSAADASSDRDDDLLTATDEYELWTNPSDADTDRDGLPDGAEFAFGLDPSDPADADYDFDGDGYSNLQEYNEGTDLTNADDKPVEVSEVPYTQGLIGQYYSGRDFDEFRFARLDTGVTNNWSSASPDSRLPNDRFSVRWYSMLVPQFDSGERSYEFRVTRDDGSRVYVDGELVVDAWTGGTGTTTFTGRKTLAAGQAYPVVVEYTEGYGGARIVMQVVDTSTGQTLDPASIFRVSPPDAEVSADTDGDSIPDVWEMMNGTDAWKNDASAVLNGQNVSVASAFSENVSPWTLAPVTAWAGTTVSSDGSGVTAPPAPVPEPVVTPDPAPAPSVTVSWTAPGTRVDGSSIALSEIVSYKINYGKTASSLGSTITISAENTSHAFEGLSSGTWYFNVQTVDQNGLLSPMSNTVSYQVK